MESFEFDFHNICRLCKSTSESMRSLFETYDKNAACPRFDEMLMACTAVSVNLGDNLPDQICQICIDNLHISYNFKQQCENTDVSLREYIKSFRSSDNIKEELYLQSQELADKTNDSENIIINNVEEIVDDISSEVANDILPSQETEDSVIVKSDPDIELNDETSNIDYIQFLENNQVLLTCRTCAKSFTTVEGMKCHKRVHTGSLFKCKECGKKYTRQNHLQRHELSHSRRKVHVCKICNKTLTRFEHLRRHLITHLKEKPFGCTTCNRGFNRAEHLTNHIKRCKGIHVYICDICNKGFNREDSLEVHKHIHNNKLPVLPTLENINNIDQHYVEIECEGMSQLSDLSESETEADVGDNFEPEVITSENYDDATNDTSLIENIENSENAEIYAEVDPAEIEDESKDLDDDYYDEDLDLKEERDDSDSGQSEYLPKPSLKRKRGRPRKYSVSKTSKTRGRSSLSKIKNEPSDDIEGEFPCPVCSEVFIKMNLLEKHALEHDGLKLHACTICNKKFSRNNHLRRHLLSHSEVKPFSCENCFKCFNRRDHLTQHMKLHYRSEDLECDICKKPFGREEQLLKHKASKHNIGDKVAGEKKFQCPVCLKGFTTEKYRDIHMKGHNGEKTFECRICHKAFLSKSHLSEHVKFHNDQSKKFLCSECGQRFIRNDYLVIHMRRHRGEKPFKCKYCGKGFPRTTDLTVHERYHTGEKTHLCTICGRGFGRAYNLTVHMRTHTGEKPYACTYCDAAFAQGNDLKAHVRRHTGERFQCELCTESFLMGYLLTQHKRTVHGLNVVSNIRRLQHVKTDVANVDDPPITIPLPPPVIPVNAMNAQLQAQMAIQQLQQQISRQ